MKKQNKSIDGKREREQMSLCGQNKIHKRWTEKIDKEKERAKEIHRQVEIKKR